MSMSERSEYYKKRLYHYLYVKIYSKWFVLIIYSYPLIIQNMIILFYRLEMYQFKHSRYKLRTVIAK